MMSGEGRLSVSSRLSSRSRMLPLAVASGAEIVGYLLTEKSQVPVTLAERMEPGDLVVDGRHGRGRWSAPIAHQPFSW